MAEKVIDVAKETTVLSLIPFRRKKIFYYTGTVQTFVVPEGVTEIYITACGGGGSGGFSSDGGSGTPTVIGSLVTLSGGAGGKSIPSDTYGVSGGAAGGIGGGAGGHGYVLSGTPGFFLGGGGGASLGGGGACDCQSSDSKVSSSYPKLDILSAITGENTDVAQGGNFYGAGFGKFGNGKAHLRGDNYVDNSGGFGAGGGGHGSSPSGPAGSGGGGADSIVQKAFSVKPNETISITVGKGGHKSHDGGDGGNGIVIIEW